MALITVDKNQKIPAYQQLINCIMDGIEKKEIVEGEILPSINKLSKDHNLARETVVKALRILQQKGIIKPVHGKGFFISSLDTKRAHRVFILFDTLSSYKEVLYESIQQGFGDEVYLDIYFHHFNFNVFRKLVEEANGNYTSYIITPFENPKINSVLHLLPQDKIYLLDRYPHGLEMKLPGVYQDFFNDVFQSLSFIRKQLKKYNNFFLVFRNTITEVPEELREGFEAFSREEATKAEVLLSLKNHNLRKGSAFLVIDDEDLVWLVEQSAKKNLEIGKDVGIISYNDTSLKKVVAGGISVISTDFQAMGNRITSMVLNGDHKQVKNKCRFIDRNSF
ncbi:MAG: GntR family transcriptional regulator [Prolixibacteraceae bacterium]